MSASNNFITRPVLSTVCSLLIVIVGLITIPILPIENGYRSTHGEVQTTTWVLMPFPLNRA